MSQLTLEEVSHLADLARLTLSPEEQEKFAVDLPKIVEFVEQLQGVKLDGDSRQTASVTGDQVGLEDRTSERLVVDHIEVAKTTPLEAMRSDEVSGGRLTLEQLENLAPTWRDGQVEVPAVFGEESNA